MLLGGEWGEKPVGVNVAENQRKGKIENTKVLDSDDNTVTFLYIFAWKQKGTRERY